ncbi:malonate decarboxylase subunit epsilon [Paenibacillus sp. Soil750]|uniref:malonate decarboxylase subunit epsilon n=1 Tax=Paenibacillus sp. Soil750 TaxID=1736398 RepID=UPI0006FACDB4|nr:malonate decarboxylase subunit epsilon [Paenibacillus sp. Soil750]KRE55912.1 malonate decarboxylase subunit epsilon [Paenibacillus sp. Soil750]
MSVAFLFPGQGSQFPGMLHQLPSHPVIETTLDEATSFMGKDALSIDTSEALSSTVSVQLAILYSGVASGRALIQEGAEPRFVAGHSVGSFAAAVISEVLSFRDACELVKLRAEWMENSFRFGYGMGVIKGIAEQKLRSMVEKAFKCGQEVFIANLNGPHQITIAGKLEHIQNLFVEARRNGARKAELLQVSVPSHCKLLNQVTYDLELAMKKVIFKEPCFPYVANTNARLLRSADAIRNDLACGVANPVQWHQATTLLSELGVRLFVEMLPGQVLTNLARQELPSVQSIAMGETRLDSVVYLINRERKWNET